MKTFEDLITEHAKLVDEIMPWASITKTCGVKQTSTFRHSRTSRI